MGVKRWNGSAYSDLNIAKVNNVTPLNALRWTGSRYGLLWPAPVQIADNFNRANSDTIGPLWNKIGAQSTLASNSYQPKTTAGSYAIQTVGSTSWDDQEVEAVAGSTLSVDSLRPQYICGRVADDGLSGVVARFTSTASALCTWTGGSMTQSSYTNFNNLTTSLDTAGGISNNDVIHMEIVGQYATVYRNGSVFMDASLSSFRKGPGYRRGALIVSQGSFIKSGSWDTFFLEDYDYA